MEAKNSLVPFVEKEIMRSASNDARYTLIGERKLSTYALIVKRDSAEIAIFKLPKQAEIHSPAWDENGVWFLVRMKTDNGSRAAAIGYINLLNNKKSMILHEVVVGANQNGMVFDILGVEKNRLKVVCRFKNGETKRYTFMQGFVNCLDLETISERDFWRRYEAANANSNEMPLRRVDGDGELDGTSPK